MVGVVMRLNMKAFLMMCAVVAPVKATTIYSQGWDGTSNGMSSTYDTVTSSEVSYVLDTFTLSQNSVVNNIGWWGGYSANFTPSSNDFYVELFDKTTNNSLYTFTDFVTVSATTDPLVSFYSMDLTTNASLSAGEYLLLIQAEHDVVQNDLSASSWYWGYDTASTGDSGLYYNNIDLANYVNGPFFLDRDNAFVLNGSIPEPTTLWLLGMAFTAMGASRKLSAARRS